MKCLKWLRSPCCFCEPGACFPARTSGWWSLARARAGGAPSPSPRARTCWSSRPRPSCSSSRCWNSGGTCDIYPGSLSSSETQCCREYKAAWTINQLDDELRIVYPINFRASTSLTRQLGSSFHYGTIVCVFGDSICCWIPRRISRFVNEGGWKKCQVVSKTKIKIKEQNRRTSKDKIVIFAELFSCNR